MLKYQFKFNLFQSPNVPELQHTRNDQDRQTLLPSLQKKKIKRIKREKMNIDFWDQNQYFPLHMGSEDSKMYADLTSTSKQ